ncbi:hypothetical protein OG592_42250 (plasmid) [Streptomyces avidinii]|uniref:hypothetical protein n=1 Tax=Streptomyces avidinii TaxID=1895 RepID=UPI002F91A1C6|nr:hypothetical protein OG592_42250 [Streptomyces avidinii]
MAKNAGMFFPVSLRSLIRDGVCPHNGCVTLHLKFLAFPTVPVSTMLAGMRRVYASAGIGVRVGSREDLFAPAFNPLVDLDVGTCSGTLAAEQTQLFNNTNNVAVTELVIYFVRSTIQPWNGCAGHPANHGGAVVASIASQWTLAHEVGHVLGLTHIDDSPFPPPAPQVPRQLDRLMTGGSTSSITNPPPDLSSSEVVTMNSSIFTRNCPGFFL